MFDLAVIKPVGILYVTREGHTQLIVDEVAKVLASQGLEAQLFDLAKVPDPSGLDAFSAIVLASPVHAGKFASQVVSFARENRARLDWMTSAFISVTLSEAGVERNDTTQEQHDKFAADVAKVNKDFFEQTGWHPTRLKNVAGALAYTHYNFLVRILMKQIARKAGGSTDTSRDHDYTDWAALDRFVVLFAGDVIARADRRDQRSA